MKILIICHRLPHPAIAFTFRVLNSIKYLSKKFNHEITLISFKEKGYSNDDLTNYCKKIETVEIPPYKSNKIIIHCILNYIAGFLFLKNKNIYNFTFSYEMEKKIAKILKNGHFDIIFVDSPTMSYYVSDVHIPKVVEIVDSIQITYDQYKIEKNILNKLIRFLIYRTHKNLIKYYNKFDRCITVTEDDKKNILSYSPNLDILVCPFGVEISKEFNHIEEDFPSIMFVGNMGIIFNQESAMYVYNEIYPKIRRIYPNIKLYIVGKDPSKEILDLANDESVIVTGYVDDIRPYLARASVVVLPIHGYGMKTRILETMAMGKPIITSSEGIHGINVTPEENIIIADEAKEFAKRVVELLKDEVLRNRIGANARKLMEDEYSWEKMTDMLNEVFHKVVNK